jgi:hypothetical protein
MKTLGIALLVVGSLWALVAFNADTTVTTESQRIGSIYIPSQEVHNIGKMDERRNHPMLSALVIVCGVILFAAGKVRAPSTPSQSDTSTSPKMTRRWRRLSPTDIYSSCCAQRINAYTLC